MILRTLLILLLTISLQSDTRQFTIASDTRILYPASDSVAKAAAEYLRKALQRVTKRSLTTQTAPDPRHNSFLLVKKDSPLLPESLRKTASTLKDDGFVIEITPDHIYLVATDDRAVWYAVYHFLEKYIGFRYVSADYTYIPPGSDLSFSSQRDIQEPAFAYREVFIHESDDWRYATQNRLNGRLGHRTMQRYQDPRYGKGIAIYNLFTPHALVPQERYHCNGQIPFSDTKIQKLAAAKVTEKIRKLRPAHDDYLYLQHEDRNSFCDSDGDTAVEATEAFMHYCAYIAAHTPGKHRFLMEAYQWSRTPPSDAKHPAPNLSVMFSTIEANFAKPLNSVENDDILEDLKGWKKYSDDTIVWHYITDFGGYLQPFPDLYAVAEDLRAFSRLPNVRGVFLQGDYESPKSEFANLRIWLFGKLLWNPNQDIDLLLHTFCDTYYGKAGEAVYRYIEALHDIAARVDQKLYLKTPPTATYLKSASLDYLEKILDAGYRRVRNDPLFAGHLLEVYANLDYIRILNETDPEKRAKSIRRFGRFLQQNPKIEQYAEGSDIASLKTIMEIPRTKPSIPAEAKGKREGIGWYDFQEYTLRLCCTRIVHDPDASDGVAAIMPGSSPDWGYQLDINTNLPKGKWRIYARVKIALKPHHSLIDKGRVAFFFGIHPTLIKGGYLIAQMPQNRYKTIEIGTIDTTKRNAGYLWLSPPANDVVNTLYVDRIFAVKAE